MRIEEACSCGASLTLNVDQEIGRLRVDERRATVSEAWKQMDRWRKLHAGCRAAKSTESKPSGEGTHA